MRGPGRAIKKWSDTIENDMTDAGVKQGRYRTWVADPK